MAQHIVLEGTATADSGYVLRSFNIKQKIVYIANDSDTYPLIVNLDKTVDQAGAFILKPGEAASDIPTNCTSIALGGVGGNVPFRVLGV